MTNEELKKKIVDIALHAEWMDMFGDHNSIGKYAANAIADALIAAGIGDVTEWKEKAKKHRVQVLPDGTIKQLYSDEEVEDIARQRDEYKHRAEVAERALLTVCTNIVTDEEDDLAVEPRARVLYKAYLKQAEKELAEEGKDD